MNNMGLLFAPPVEGHFLFLFVLLFAFITSLHWLVPSQWLFLLCRVLSGFSDVCVRALYDFI